MTNSVEEGEGGMAEKRAKVCLRLLLPVFLFGACTSAPAAEETLFQTSSPALTEMPAQTPPPTTPVPVVTPEREDGTVILAGRELEYVHLLRVDDSKYGYSTGREARLEELFESSGFVAEAPFYTYENEEEQADITLWYNEETGVGIGICDSYGFAFESTGWALEREDDEESRGFDYWYRWEEDLIPSEPEWLEMENYREEREYDEAGRLVKMETSGEFPGWDGQRLWVYSLRLDYDENGIVRHRSFGQNGMLFGSTNPGQNGYFDAQGRLVYERGYITHGHTETYYIYEGDNTTPSYGLYLDYDAAPYCFPDFVSYRAEK